MASTACFLQSPVSKAVPHSVVICQYLQAPDLAECNVLLTLP